MFEIENQGPPPPPPPQNWIFAHPYGTTIIVVFLLIVTGIVVVSTHSVATPPAPSSTSFGGDIGTLVDSTAYVPDKKPPKDITQQVKDSPPYSYSLPTLEPGKTPPNTGTDDFDYKQFVKAVDDGAHLGASAPTFTTNNDITYAFPPNGLFSTTSVAIQHTPEQEALYNYGNEVGSVLESYEQQHPDQTQVLKNQIEDRGNEEKARLVVQMAHDLQNIGRAMQGIEDIPPQIAKAHDAVAKSYIEIGANLALVPDATTGTDILKAINTYNKSADAFSASFTKYVSVFTTYGVTFNEGDSGSVFTFSFSSGF